MPQLAGGPKKKRETRFKEAGGRATYLTWGKKINTNPGLMTIAEWKRCLNNPCLTCQSKNKLRMRFES